jgi:hypothetical protein
MEDISMIQDIVETATRNCNGNPWHFKYQPINGGPVVSLAPISHGRDWIRLYLPDESSTYFYVHERSMSWATIDWECETLRPYTGKPTI